MQPVREIQNKKKSNSGIIILIIILIITAIALKDILGRYSLRLFIFLDNIFNITNNVLVNWIIIGLFTGFIYGTWVAWRKYKLSFFINLISIGAFLLFVLILLFINKPSDSEAFSPIKKTETKYAYNLVNVVDKSVSTSKNANIYAVNLVDSNSYSAYIDDFKKSSKENPVIQFSFFNIFNYLSKNLKFKGCMIQNGNRQSENLWNNYGRIKEISIFKNDSLLVNAFVSDSFEESQIINVQPVSINEYDFITVKINSIYPGRRYIKKLAITELIPIIQFDEVYY